MDEAGDRQRLQPGEQPREEMEIRLVDELAVGLERVGPIGDAVEDRTRTQLIEQGVEVRVDQQVHSPDVAGR